MSRERQGQLENILKGIANHRRIQIVELLDTSPDLSGFDISDKLGVDFRTVSLHTRRLAQSGLIKKRHEGSMVLHSLSDRGKAVLVFARTLE